MMIFNKIRPQKVAFRILTVLLIIAISTASTLSGFSFLLINPNIGIESAQATESGLISYWPAENDANDAMGVNNGVANGATYVPGRVVQAFSFDGSDDYINVPDSASLDITSELTIDAWVKPNGIGVGNGIIVMKNPLKYGLVWLPSTQKISFSLDIGGWSDYVSTSTVPVGQWSHVVGTYDSSNVRIYINGILDVEIPKTGSIATSTENLTFGKRTDLTEIFNGLIDEIKIYNRVLSASEIAGLYESVPPESLDYGDAPDPTFPSLKSNNGARHTGLKDFYFGSDVDYETNSRQIDIDNFDDGLIKTEPLSFFITNPSGIQRYVNILADLNKDGNFDDEGEWVVQNFGVTSSGFKTPGSSLPYEAWIRMTITNVPLENYIGTTQIPFNGGETEDHFSPDIWGPPTIIKTPPIPPWGPGSPPPGITPTGKYMGPNLYLEVEADDSIAGKSNIEKVVASIDGGAETQMSALYGSLDAFKQTEMLLLNLSGLPEPNGLHTITVKAMDSEGNWGQPTALIINVDSNGANQPPVVDAGGPYLLEDFNSTIQLNGLGSIDPNKLTGDYITSYTWDLNNDGQYNNAYGPSPLFASSQGNPSDTALFGGKFRVDLKVTDTFGASDTDAAEVRINQPFPAFTVNPSQPLTNQQITFDPSASVHGNSPERSIENYEWDFDYDGHNFQTDSTDPIGNTITHQYDSPGTRTAALKVTDDNDPPKTAITTQTIDVIAEDAPPVVRITEPATGSIINEGDNIILSASWIDNVVPNTIKVNWGDGYTSTYPDYVTFDEQTGNITASHVYQDNNTVILQGEPGPYPVTVEAGGETSPPVNIQVNNVPPAVDAGQDRTIFEGETLDCNSNNVPDELDIQFNDPAGASDAPYNAIIDWGDGAEPVQGSVIEVNSSRTVNGSHVYAVNGTYTVKVTVTDDDGGVGIDTFKVTVLDKTPPVIWQGLTTQNNGKYVRGVVNLRTNATDNVGVSLVQYFRDSLANLIGSNAINPYSTNWDTRTAANGRHNVLTYAYDAAGNHASASTALNVDNYKPRTYAPRKSRVRKGSYVKIYYKVYDPFTGNIVNVIIVIKKKGKTIKKYDLRKVRANVLNYIRKKANFPKGNYDIYVYATDQAGNKQYNIAHNKLEVK